MKKILIAAVGAMALMTAQAQAGNEGALIGGLIGGIIIGGALSHHHEYVPRYRDPYYNDEYGYEQHCYTQYRQHWNEYYEQWERDPVTVCRWERRW